MSDWILGDASALPWVVVSTVGISVAIIVAVRLLGLRSFSKMSSFDFVMTVAAGSLMATTLVSETPSLAQGIVGLGALFATQFAVARFRLGGEPAGISVDNSPILLMDGDRMLRENMRSEAVTEADLLAKLREANVLDLAEVRAVVLETTGDVSVLHGPPNGAALDEVLLSEVRRSPDGG